MYEDTECEGVRDGDIGFNKQIDNTLIVSVNNDNTIIAFYFHIWCTFFIHESPLFPHTHQMVMYRQIQ